VASCDGPPSGARKAQQTRANTERARPLRGLRVIELCWVWAGPLLGAIMADLGAEVIKIEHISRMDSSRLRGRPADRSIPAAVPDYETVPYFHQMNHGKKSVSINLRTPEGREEAFRLAAGADVLIENLRPGALDRAGLGYRELSAANPEIVYVALSATGRGGPLEDIRAYAPVLSSLAGLERSIGYEDGTVTGMMTHAFSDPNAAIYGLMCCLAAIRRRRITGKGCFLDVSQLDAVLSVTREAVVAASITGEQPPLRGDSHVSFVPFGHFQCAGDDEWVAVCVTDDQQWAAAKAVIGDPRLDTPAFDTAPGRAASRPAIDAVITDWSATMTPTAAAEKLLAVGVDAAPVLGAAAALERARTRGRIADVTHARTGAEELWSLPWTFDGEILAPASAAPLLGADTGWSDT
jgi:crotonobetainyl-CoA:carnitine CoA-transferase CaiB-like acyl-CoA transferase